MDNVVQEENIGAIFKRCLVNGLWVLFSVGVLLAFFFSIIYFYKSIELFYQTITSCYPYAFIYMGSGYLSCSVAACIGCFLLKTMFMDSPNQEIKATLKTILGVCFCYNIFLIYLFSVQHIVSSLSLNNTSSHPYLLVSAIVLYLLTFPLFSGIFYTLSDSKNQKLNNDHSVELISLALSSIVVSFIFYFFVDLITIGITY